VYLFVLSLHNVLRWLVVILTLAAAVNAFWGWFGKRAWSERDRKLGVFVSMGIDIQLLLGLLLYFVISPLMTETILPNFGGAMKNSELRFFAIEHIFLMVLVVVFAHLGSILAKRGKDSTARFRRAAIWFTLTLALILAGLPWFRPLLRLGEFVLG
jgi:uncharacterized membrane protein YozB (DUF420 family)